MKSDLIIKLSFFCSIFGIILIYVSSINIKPQDIRINEITENMIGSKVKVTGFIVNRYNHRDGHVFLTIEDETNSRIEIPLFKSFVNSFEKYSEQKAKKRDLKSGSLVEVEGIVGEYNGKLQIVPNDPNDLMILYD